MSSTLYTEFENQTRKIALLGNTLGLMSWDQEVGMPAKGAGIRAHKMSLLSGMVHDIQTAAPYVSITRELMEDVSLSEEQRVNVKEVWRMLEKSLKVPTAFVEEMSHTISAAFNAWQQAKAEKKFEIFAPMLEKLVKLKKEEAEMLGYNEHPYNAFLDQYDPGLTVKEVDTLFADVRRQLVDFVQRIARQPQPDDAFFRGGFDLTTQEAFGRELLEKMGYDFQAGRMDRAPHPFCIGLHPMDTRITYRVKQEDLSEIIWGVIHEGGHALYEQGLKPEYFGMPMGTAVSLSIHESQSRLWENNVGRSLAYWEYFLPQLRQRFPGQLEQVQPVDFFRACNRVEPSLIRTSADELTYHFHIMIRYEIEKAIFENTVSVNDLPALWNARYKEYLGIDVPDDAAGILQDVHWSHGSFGYFPTYSLGSFYATQFYAAAAKALPDLEENIRQGQLLPLREWLRENIHQLGMRYPSGELCRRVTGESLRFQYFMDYAHQKYATVYPGLA